MKYKYYTPDISEFHVGFEYEILDPTTKDHNGYFQGKKDFLGNIISYTKTIVTNEIRRYNTKVNNKPITVQCHDPNAYIVINPGWESRIYKEGDALPITQLVFEDNIIQSKSYGYRVKYLDKEGIEKLGFKYQDSLSGDDKYSNGKYFLTYTPSNQWLSIRYFNEFTENTQIFYGIIKNKSELKKLINQLKILNE